MPERIVADLRSDTVTRATPEMRRAMAEAEVGDDSREGDPTARRLEARAAELTGHQAALFCSSGTMGNLVAFMAHLRPGDGVISERKAHFLHYESGGVSCIAGGIPRTVPSIRGRMDLDQLASEIDPGTKHRPRTALIVAENTHNLAGGTCLDVAYMEGLWKVAADHDIPVHLDGARVWNAAIALGVPISALTSGCASVMVDLSKGLCAPYGSLLCGHTDVIERARDLRQRVGGGVRQIGHMAAAGLVALNTMIDRLAEDHANARRLAEGIHAVRPDCVDLDLVQSNMVIVETAPLDLTGAELAAKFTDARVPCLPFGPHHLRLVTHHDVGADQTDQALEVILKVMGSTSPT